MSYETWIEEYLWGRPELKSLLTSFNKKPALFYQKKPTDKDKGWDKKVYYPSLLYRVKREETETGQRLGSIRFTVLCTEDPRQLTEITEVLKSCLDGLLIKVEEKSHSYIAWNKSKGFKNWEKEFREESVYGMYLYFSWLELDSWENLDPDPVATVYRYLKGKKYPLVMAEAGQQLCDGDLFLGADTPVCYLRMDQVKTVEETNTMIWLEGKLGLHILCPNPNSRIKWGMLLLHQLSLEGELVQIDEAPMAFQELEANFQEAYWKNGQLQITVRYAYPKYQELRKKITGAFVNPSQVL